MELDARLGLLHNSKQAKRLEELRPHLDSLTSQLQEEVTKLGQAEELLYREEMDCLESQMMVCVRTRPLLDHELAVMGDIPALVHTANPRVLVTQPSTKLDPRSREVRVSVASSVFSVDMAFGPEDDNQVVYTNTVPSLLDTSLKGGVGTLFAYGQTGSGKTHTVTGIIERLAEDLFIKKEDHIQLHLSFIQLLGNNMTDLLAEEDSESSVSVMEDKFGKIQMVGAREDTVSRPEEILELAKTALARRSTAATLKNDTSSRSHAVIRKMNRLRMENTSVRSAEDGFLYLIDLAGSENAGDSQFHDKSRLQETRAINTSLMCLKDCIRNRCQASLDPSQHVHIPYRQSKLSLLLKDAFELESFRKSRTVVIANVAPSLIDLAQTLNTLRYVGPIKQGLKNKVQREPDPKNPANWDNERLKTWVTGKSKAFCKGKVKPETLCPWETGKQLLSLPESELLSRLQSDGLSEKAAKEFYLSLWKILIDARTRQRDSKLKAKAKKRDPAKLVDPNFSVAFYIDGEKQKSEESKDWNDKKSYL